MSIHIGERIKKLKEAKKITNRALAEALHMTEANVYKLFAKADMDTALLRHIAEVLEVEINYFLDENTDPLAGNTTAKKGAEPPAQKNSDKRQSISEEIMNFLEKQLAAKDRKIEELVEQLAECKIENRELRARLKKYEAEQK